MNYTCSFYLRIWCWECLGSGWRTGVIVPIVTTWTEWYSAVYVSCARWNHSLNVLGSGVYGNRMMSKGPHSEGEHSLNCPSNAHTSNKGMANFTVGKSVPILLFVGTSLPMYATWVDFWHCILKHCWLVKLILFCDGINSCHNTHVLSPDTTISNVAFLVQVLYSLSRQRWAGAFVHEGF